MKFPAEVPGWLSLEEGEALAQFAEGRTVLEIGSFCGRSTICLAQAARFVVSVDPHDARTTPGEGKGGNTLLPFVKALHEYGLLGKVACVVGTTETVRPHLPAIFDRVFIDGDHSYRAVCEDLDWAARLLRGESPATTGFVACHDYRTGPGEHDGRWDPGVTQAVDEACRSGWTLLSRAGTVAILQPPHLQPRR